MQNAVEEWTTEHIFELIIGPIVASGLASLVTYFVIKA